MSEVPLYLDSPVCWNRVRVRSKVDGFVPRTWDANLRKVSQADAAALGENVTLAGLHVDATRLAAKVCLLFWCRGLVSPGYLERKRGRVCTAGPGCEIRISRVARLGQS